MQTSTVEWWYWLLFVFGHAILWFFTAFFLTLVTVSIISILAERIWYGTHELSNKAARNRYCWLGVIAISIIAYVIMLKYNVIK